MPYDPSLIPTIEDCKDLIKVLEVEPQTLWVPDIDNEGAFLQREHAMDMVPKGIPVVLHGIGTPVGGSILPDPMEMDLIADCAQRFDARWVSEHMAFNRFEHDGKTAHSGFLLPPIQNNDGVNHAVRSIHSMVQATGRPFAIEVGTNYLQPIKEEIPDGTFIRQIAEKADCGILLDLHNIWTNEQNGRQDARTFIESIPLEQVVEIHVAGGQTLDGYWLDAHSDLVPPPVMDLLHEVVPRVPNLKAIMFEIFADYVSQVPEGAIKEQLKELHQAWANRRPTPPMRRGPVPPSRSSHLVSPGLQTSAKEWEDALGCIVTGAERSTPLAQRLADDPGTAIYHRLVNEFRGAMVVETLRLTCRLIMLHQGIDAFKELLQTFWSQGPVDTFFFSTEARRFAAFLRQDLPDVPYIDQVLSYETDVLESRIRDTEIISRFQWRPDHILGPLTEGRMPESPEPGEFEVAINPRSLVAA